MNDNHEAFIADALQIVEAWEVPPEDFARAVNDQARLLAGLDLEPALDIPDTSAYSTLRF